MMEIVIFHAVLFGAASAICSTCGLSDFISHPTIMSALAIAAAAAHGRVEVIALMQPRLVGMG